MARFKLGARRMIRDARGRMVPVCEPSQLPSEAGAGLRKLVKAANEHRVLPELARLIALVLGVVVFRYVFTAAGCRRVPAGMPPFPPDPLIRTVWTAVVIVAVALPLQLWILGSRSRNRAAACVRGCLEARLCPSCCYPLIEEGARRRCTECGSAWHAATS